MIIKYVASKLLTFIFDRILDIVYLVSSNPEKTLDDFEKKVDAKFTAIDNMFNDPEALKSRIETSTAFKLFTKTVWYIQCAFKKIFPKATKSFTERVYRKIDDLAAKNEAAKKL